MEDSAVSELQDVGYSNVKLTGMYYGVMCGKMMPINHTFEAMKDGKIVTGRYCGGMFGAIIED